jgi:restriction system protein
MRDDELAVESALTLLESGAGDNAATTAAYATVLTPLLRLSDYEPDKGAEVPGIELAFRDPEPDSDSWFTTLGVILKHGWSDEPVGATEVSAAVRFLERAFDRVLLLSGAGFSASAKEIAQQHNPYTLQLMGLSELRQLVRRTLGPPLGNLSRVKRAVKRLSRELAREIAVRPDALSEIEWRDLERMTAEIFEALGFRVELTRPAKDGGRDLVLTCKIMDENQTFFVEIKHWVSGKHVPETTVKEFIKVVVKEGATRGLIVSTSGYAAGLVEALTEIERQRVHLKGRESLITLCQLYVRAESSLWSPPEHLPDLIFGESAL